MYRVHELLANTLGIEGMFVTAFYAVIEPENGRMRYARAGHDRPLHYRRGQINPLPGEGRFIGLFERPTIEERELQLQSGDMLVLFSDGVTDALSPKGEQFGIERLSDVVRERATSGAQAVCDAVFARVRAFQDTASQFDDITLQIIAYQEKHRGGDN
jgi:sigma-B regulation protein RsbU (phosphoserine phosphatase)